MTDTRIIDLSHPIRGGLVTYPGLPAPVITPHLTREASRATYAPGTEFAMDVITMIGNTGTYLDSPFHRYADGADLAGLDLSTLVGLRAEVFHLTDAWEPGRRGIRPEALADRDVRGAAVLLHTGWDEHFGGDEVEERSAGDGAGDGSSGHGQQEGAVVVQHGEGFVLAVAGEGDQQEEKPRVIVIHGYARSCRYRAGSPCFIIPNQATSFPRAAPECWQTPLPA